MYPLVEIKSFVLKKTVTYYETPEFSKETFEVCVTLPYMHCKNATSDKYWSWNFSKIYVTWSLLRKKWKISYCDTFFQTKDAFREFNLPDEFKKN